MSDDNDIYPVPTKLYLQLGAGEEGTHTWCEDRIEDSDVEYIAMAEYDAIRAELQATKAAIRAMWPVFALALAYGEHGRASEHNGLRRLAEEFRNNPPAGVMDTILDAAKGR